eukprot:12937388-Prorocentrum_lima.AAC.1
MHDLPPGDERYWDYAEEVVNCAGAGTLLEVSAVCAAYKLQAVVCARSHNRFVILGKEGQTTISLSFQGLYWDLIPDYVCLPPRAKMHQWPA